MITILLTNVLTYLGDGRLRTNTQLNCLQEHFSRIKDVTNKIMLN